MKPREVFESLMNIDKANFSKSISDEDEYGKVVITAKLLSANNVIYAKHFVEDNILGKINKYRYKLEDTPDEDEDLIAAQEDATSLFTSMVSSYLNKIRLTDDTIKCIIIFLIHNKKINEFRNIPKLVNSEWGVRTTEFLSNLGMSNKMILESYLPEFDEYPIHRSILECKLHELMTTNNCRERYNVLMKDAWNAGELSPNDPKEKELSDSIVNLRSTMKSMLSKVKVIDLCKVLDIAKSTYERKKGQIIKDLSKYYYNSIYSSMIDMVNSMD
jgi:hypothetical protein